MLIYTPTPCARKAAGFSYSNTRPPHTQNSPEQGGIGREPYEDNMDPTDIGPARALVISLCVSAALWCVVLL